MAVDPVVLALSVLGRIYFGLSVEHSVMVSEKAVEVAGSGADEVDLIDAFDDVWAASLTAGIIMQGDPPPIHPLQMRDELLSSAVDEHEREHVMENYPKDDGIVRPKRYKDPSLIATKKRKKNKRRSWDKN